MKKEKSEVAASLFSWQNHIQTSIKNMYMKITKNINL